MAGDALGFLLQYLREQRGLSLRELGQLADVDHAYVYRLETSAKDAPSEEVLSKLIRSLKAERREADILRYVASHPGTDAALVEEFIKDRTIPYVVFPAVAGMTHRGTGRPEYAKLIARVRRVLSEDSGDG